MPSQKNLNNLKGAVELERTQAVTTSQYHALMKKMVAYSEGKCPAPTIEDFLEWRNSVDRVQHERNSGFADLD